MQQKKTGTTDFFRATFASTPLPADDGARLSAGWSLRASIRVIAIAARHPTAGQKNSETLRGEGVRLPPPGTLTGDPRVTIIRVMAKLQPFTLIYDPEVAGHLAAIEPKYH